MKKPRGEVPTRLTPTQKNSRTRYPGSEIAPASQQTATIVALATAPAAGAVGIIRLSGRHALEIARPLADRLPKVVIPRHAYFVSFKDRAGSRLDQGLFLYFEAPHSFTGEDVVELQTHGSPVLLSLLQSELLADNRVRLAEPGEFSRRAFLNGRIDLVRAEAIAELVAARSSAAVRAAGAQLSGAFARQIRILRGALLTLYADIEGDLNFPDEADGASDGYRERLTRLLAEATSLSTGAAQSRLIRAGAQVVLFGRVNAGKSTLFNALVGGDRALVDDEPGTTRDVLEATIELDGLPVTFVDTAGLRVSPGRVEALGIARAEQAIRAADLLVLVSPPDETDAERVEWRRVGQGKEIILVRSKRDLSTGASTPEIQVSGKTGAGVNELRRALAAKLWGDHIPAAVNLISARQELGVRRALESIGRAKVAAEMSTLEVVAGELGEAVEALGEIIGDTSTETLLDEIFLRFCIGK